MAGEGPAARPGGARPPARDAEAAMRRHRERHAFLARRRGAPLPAGAAEGEGWGGAEVKAEEAEEVVICKLERAVEAAEAAPAAAAVVGGKRRREGDGAAEAGPSGRGARARGPGNAGRGASRFRGVTKKDGRKAKPWQAKTSVTEDGKGRTITIGTFAREEDAARAYDRVSIAKLGHAEAKTNFPVVEYRAEWAELEVPGVDAAAARERQRARELEA